MLSNGHLSKQEKEAFIDLGFLSSLRGTDSTGLVTISKKKPKSPKISYMIDKCTDNPVVFFMQPDILDTIKKPNVSCLMGHSRAAVFGDINDLNAHPYQEGKLVGMHNGVVRKYTPPKWEEKQWTDSRKLYQAIDKEGLEPVLANLYGKDAYALTYLDTDAGTINMVRNSERPLHFAVTKHAMFWSSEAYMLRLALSRNYLEIEELTSLGEDTLFTYDFLTTNTTSVKLELEDHRVPFGVPGFFPKDQAQDNVGPNVIIMQGMGRPGSHASRVGYVDEWMKKQATEDPLNDPLPYLLAKPDYPFLGDLADIPLGARYSIKVGKEKEWIEIPEAINLLSKGCFNCRSPSSIDDDIYWLAPSVHLCSECHSLPVMQGVLKQQNGAIKGEYDDNQRLAYAY